MKISGVPKFIHNRERWAYFSSFGKVEHVIRDGLPEARIYFEDMRVAFKAIQMREHELPGLP